MYSGYHYNEINSIIIKTNFDKLCHYTSITRYIMNVIITRVNLYYKFCFLKKCHYSEIVIITDVIITGVTCIIMLFGLMKDPIIFLMNWKILQKEKIPMILIQQNNLM